MKMAAICCCLNPAKREEREAEDGHYDYIVTEGLR